MNRLLMFAVLFFAAGSFGCHDWAALSSQWGQDHTVPGDAGVEATDLAGLDGDAGELPDLARTGDMVGLVDADMITAPPDLTGDMVMMDGPAVVPDLAGDMVTGPDLTKDQGVDLAGDMAMAPPDLAKPMIDMAGPKPDMVVVPPACQNGVKDNQETDIDCGGGQCPKCGEVKKCVRSTDCTTAFCDAGLGICVPILSVVSGIFDLRCWLIDNTGLRVSGYQFWQAGKPPIDFSTANGNPLDIKNLYIACDRGGAPIANLGEFNCSSSQSPGGYGNENVMIMGNNRAVCRFK